MSLSTRLELHCQPIRSGQFFLVSLFSKTDSSDSPGFGLVTGLFGCAPPKPNKISLPCWLSLLMGIPCRCRQTPSQVPTQLRLRWNRRTVILFTYPRPTTKNPPSPRNHILDPLSPGFTSRAFFLVCLSICSVLAVLCILHYYNIRLPSTYLFKLFFVERLPRHLSFLYTGFSRALDTFMSRSPQTLALRLTQSLAENLGLPIPPNLLTCLWACGPRNLPQPHEQKRRRFLRYMGNGRRV